VPALLRASGLRLVTLAEHYGIPPDEDIADVTWLEEVGRRRWAAFMKDATIKRRPLKKAALVAFQVRAFCLAGGNLPATEMAQRFIHNVPAIAAACRERGPILYAVHAERINRLKLD